MALVKEAKSTHESANHHATTSSSTANTITPLLLLLSVSGYLPSGVDSYP